MRGRLTWKKAKREWECAPEAEWVNGRYVTPLRQSVWHNGRWVPFGCGDLPRMFQWTRYGGSPPGSDRDEDPPYPPVDPAADLTQLAADGGLLVLAGFWGTDVVPGGGLPGFNELASANIAVNFGDPPDDGLWIGWKFIAPGEVLGSWAPEGGVDEANRMFMGYVAIAPPKGETFSSATLVGLTADSGSIADGGFGMTATQTVHGDSNATFDLVLAYGVGCGPPVLTTPGTALMHFAGTQWATNATFEGWIYPDFPNQLPIWHPHMSVPPPNIEFTDERGLIRLLIGGDIAVQDSFGNWWFASGFAPFTTGDTEPEWNYDTFSTPDGDGIWQLIGRFRGAWQPNTRYELFDLILDPGNANDGHFDGGTIISDATVSNGGQLQWVIQAGTSGDTMPIFANTDFGMSGGAIEDGDVLWQWYGMTTAIYDRDIAPNPANFSTGDYGVMMAASMAEGTPYEFLINRNLSTGPRPASAIGAICASFRVA